MAIGIDNTKLVVSEGTLIVGETDNSLIESGVHPGDIQDLGSLLLEKSDVFPSTDQYEPLYCDDWDKDDYRSYARWLNAIVEVADADAVPPTEAVYQRAYDLGVGPEPRRITRRFGPLWQFHDELGFEGGYCRGKYENWSTRDFVNYGRQVVSSLGNKKPTEAILRELFSHRKGPSPALIGDRIGGVGRFQELLGFPYIADWTEDDYISYGVKVTLANPDVKLTRDVFDELSRRKRGPSTRTIVNHFDKLGKFQERIKQEAQLAIADQENEQRLKLESRLQLIEKGLIPEVLLDELESGDQKRFIRTTAAFMIADGLLGDSVRMGKKVDIARVQAVNLVGSMQRYDSSISAGMIEVKAVQLGIFDDIWPMDDYLEDLRVSAKTSG